MTNDPFVGTWALNPARSEFDPNHRPREATMTFEIEDGSCYLMQAAGRNERGEMCAERAQRFIADGKAYPVPDMKGLTSVATRTSPVRIDTDVRREDGTLAGQSTLEVSEDRTSLMATNAGFDSQLRQYRQFTVWERQ